MSIDENGVYRHAHTVEDYSVLKKVGISLVCEMDFEGIMLSDISQKEKEKYHMVSLTCKI